MAALCGVGKQLYRDWESGIRTPPREEAPAVGKIAPHERHYLHRRREGLSRKELARLLGVSCQWVTSMEHGRVSGEMLAAFWGSRQ